MNYKYWTERLVQNIFKIYKCYSYQSEGEIFLLLAFPRFEIYVLSVDKMNSYLFYRDYYTTETHEFNLYHRNYYDTMDYIISELQILLKYKDLTWEDCIATSIKLHIETTGKIYDEGHNLFVWKPLMLMNHNRPKHPRYVENFFNGPGWLIVRTMKSLQFLCSDQWIRLIQQRWRYSLSRRVWALNVIEEFGLRPNHLLYKRVMNRYNQRSLV